MTWQYFAVNGISSGALTFLVVVAIWELVWKAIALWKCGRNNHLIWFIFILILNTAGILPIVYLLFFQGKSVKQAVVKKKKR